MKTFLIKSALFILIGILPLSCKKYEEGPWFSLRSIENRINGNWKLEYLYINDNDSTSRVKEQECYDKLLIKINSKTPKTGSWQMYKGPTFLNVYGTCFIGGKNCNEFNIWNFRDSSCFQSVGAYLRPGEFNWTITRLTNKQFWIKTTWNNQRTWAHFKKIES